MQRTTAPACATRCAAICSVCSVASSTGLSKTGEHYIAETLADYCHIWAVAAAGRPAHGNGAKMAIAGAGLVLFLEGLASGLNHAVSFDPAGPRSDPRHQAAGHDGGRLAAIIRDRKGSERLDVIVDAAAAIRHSQLAATIANVVVVVSGPMPSMRCGIDHRHTLPARRRRPCVPCAEPGG